MWENGRGRARAAFKGGAGSWLSGGSKGNRGGGGLVPNNEKRRGYGCWQRPGPDVRVAIAAIRT
jgi:hypothetical protein